MSNARADELLREAATLADGLKRKVELIEEAIRVADSENDDALSYRARLRLVPAATWAGEVDKMLVAFAWCVGRHEAEPAKSDAYEILWYSKWAALEAPRFPAVSRARIAQLLDDTEARFRSHGASLRPVFQHRHYAAIELGDLDDAKAHYDRWWSEPRDFYADCAACEASAKLDYALVRDDDDGALGVADEIIRKRQSCAEVPHRIYGLTLAPLLKKGRVDEAKAAHRTGMRMLAKIEHNMAVDVSRHASFCALTHNFTSAVRVMSRVLPRAAEHRLPSTRAHVFADLAVICSLLAESGRGRVLLPLVEPLTAPVDAKGRVDVAALGESAWKEAARIAALYDKRNGNSSFSANLEKKRALAKFAVDAPLVKPRAPSSTKAKVRDS